MHQHTRTRGSVGLRLTSLRRPTLPISLRGRSGVPWLRPADSGPPTREDGVPKLSGELRSMSISDDIGGRCEGGEEKSGLPPPPGLESVWLPTRRREAGGDVTESSSFSAVSPLLSLFASDCGGEVTSDVIRAWPWPEDAGVEEGGREGVI